MPIRRLIPLVLLVFVIAGRSALSQATPPAAAAVTYTDEQATHGGEVFSRVCVECHARKDFSNSNFRVTWNGRTAFDLFERIRSTMPESDPGSLLRNEYVDVTAYIVKLNNIAAGTVPLPDDEASLKKLSLPFPPAAQKNPTARR